MNDPQGAPQHADADAGGAAPDPRAGAAAAAQRRPLPADQEQQERPGQDEARLQAADGRTTAGQYFTPGYLQIDLSIGVCQFWEIAALLHDFNNIQ